VSQRELQEQGKLKGSPTCIAHSKSRMLNWSSRSSSDYSADSRRVFDFLTTIFNDYRKTLREHIRCILEKLSNTGSVGRQLLSVFYVQLLSSDFPPSLIKIGQNYVKWFIAVNACRVAGKSYDPPIGCLLFSATSRDELSYFFTPSSLVVRGFMSRVQRCKCIVCVEFSWKYSRRRICALSDL